MIVSRFVLCFVCGQLCTRVSTLFLRPRLRKQPWRTILAARAAEFNFPVPSAGREKEEITCSSFFSRPAAVRAFYKLAEGERANEVDIFMTNLATNLIHAWFAARVVAREMVAASIGVPSTHATASRHLNLNTLSF